MHLPEDVLEVYNVYSTLTFTYVHLLVLISYPITQCTVTDHLNVAVLMCNINGSRDTWGQNIGMFSAAWRLWLLPKCFVY